MTKISKLSLIAFAAGACLAGAAQAEDTVHVSTIGKDAKAMHAELLQAARHVCAGESMTPHFTLQSDRDICVRNTVAKAEADYQEMKGLQLAMVHGG